MLLFVILKSQGKAVFHQEYCRGSSTQWIFSFFFTTIHFLPHEVSYCWGTWGQGHVRGRPMTKTPPENHDCCCESLFHKWQVVLEWWGNAFYFPVFAGLAHNRQRLGMDAGWHYQIYSDYALHGQTSEKNLPVERSKMTEVICTVWSPGLADTSDHMGWARWKLWQDLAVLLLSPVSTVNQNASDMRFAVQGRVREQGQHSLPNFDRGMGKHQRSVSTGNMINFFSTTATMHTAFFFSFFMVHNTR